MSWSATANKVHLVAPQWGDDVGSIYERPICGKKHGSVTSNVPDVTCRRCLKVAGHPIPAVLKGDYVLATKYSDGDPGDHWCVGWYDRPLLPDRHIVVDSAGKPFRANGFRHVTKIVRGEGLWMIEHIPEIEKTMFETVEDPDGTERRTGRSVYEWLAMATLVVEKCSADMLRAKGRL